MLRRIASLPERCKLHAGYTAAIKPSAYRAHMPHFVAFILRPHQLRYAPSPSPTPQGNRTPHTDPLSRGALAGLTLRHGRGHVFRALLEAVAAGGALPIPWGS